MKPPLTPKVAEERVKAFNINRGALLLITITPPNPTQRPFDTYEVAGKEYNSLDEAIIAANALYEKHRKFFRRTLKKLLAKW